MLKLDRKPNVPDDQFGVGPTIYQSEHRKSYELIDKRLLGEVDGPYKYQVNQKVYQKPG